MTAHLPGHRPIRGGGLFFFPALSYYDADMLPAAKCSAQKNLLQNRSHFIYTDYINRVEKYHLASRKKPPW